MILKNIYDDVHMYQCIFYTDVQLDIWQDEWNSNYDTIVQSDTAARNWNLKVYVEAT